jgi:hypothetical protein
MRPCRALPVVAAALAVVGLRAAPALAQMAHVPETDWRQPDRHDAIQRATVPANFTVEARFGPYFPDIDANVPTKKTPFNDVFGIQCSPTGVATPGTAGSSVSGGLEVDYTPFRIPYVGAIGPAIGWSIAQFSAPAVITGSTKCSQENTNLMIMPMHGSVVLRADELMRRTGVPLVPYGKIGIGLAYWRSSNDSGTETVCGTSTDPVRCGMGQTVLAHGSGLTPSVHFAVGAALALNWIQPQAAARLEQTSGVHHAYLFGEYFNDTVTLSQAVMHVGASSWVAGMSVDF